MKMRKFLLPVSILVVIVALNSCDQIEEGDTSRSVVVSVMHPNDIDYSCRFGINDPTNYAEWDTTGNISFTLELSVGDAVQYGVNSNAPGYGVSITVDDVAVLSVNPSGTAPNVVNGYLIIE
jgi:hypothetical protein